MKTEERTRQASQTDYRLIARSPMCFSVLTISILLLTSLYTSVSLAEFSDAVPVQNPLNEDRLVQRELFKEATRLIRLRRKSDYREFVQELKDYPLYPYLEYEEIINHFSKADSERVNTFVEQYKNTPLARQLMYKWLGYLGRRELWHRYSLNYEDNYRTSKLECYKGYSMYRLGQHKAAFETAQKLWLVDHSQADACDSLFKAWKGAGRLTPDIAWQRFTKSLNGNNVRLANYLMRYLSNEGRTRAKQYKRVRSNPALISKYSRFKEDNPENRKFILNAVSRLARSDASAAMKHYMKYDQTHRFSKAKQESMQLVLAIRVALQSDQFDQLKEFPFETSQHPDLIEAIARNRLKHQDWPSLIKYISALPVKNQEHPRWQYWRARALLESQDETERKHAIDTFKLLATSRSFYGFLAADTMNVSYEFAHASSVINKGNLYSLEQLPGIQRALELYAIDEKIHARREWLYATQNFSAREHVIAAKIARNWGWHKQAIQSTIKASSWNDLDTRFPIAFRDEFSSGASKAEIPLQFGLAIARQESAFMPDAQSSAGALGVMQLLPSTAKITARKIGLRYRSSRDLLDPSFNIKLGTAYLGMMLKRFDNNRILASVAYNAGPLRVKQWRDDSLPLDIWIESIPFKETRQYVKNVLMFSTIYGRHLNEKLPLIYPHERKGFAEPSTQLSGILGMVEPLPVQPGF